MSLDQRYIKRGKPGLYHEGTVAVARLRVQTNTSSIQYQTLLFSDSTISCTETTTGLQQCKQIKKLQPIPLEYVDKSSCVLQRALGAYSASTCHSDLTFGFAFYSQVLNVDAISAKRLNKYISVAKENPETGLNFVAICTSFLRISFFADTSFSSNCDLSSQLGFFVTLAYKRKKANILRYLNFKVKRITRTLLVA